MKKLLSLILLTTSSVYSLPIDWHGRFGVSTNLIKDFRRVDSKTDNSSSNDGTTEVPFGTGSNVNANWQNYFFSLEPHIIVNDTATIKAELTSGYGRGGRVGDATAPTKTTSLGNSLYLNNINTDTSNSLLFNKLYAEIYADTATYLIGRHTYNFGLGAIINDGEGDWNRFPYIRDGITIKIKIGNFLLEPYWTRQSAGNSLTKATRVKDSGIALNYSNTNKDMSFGVLYSKKKSGSDPSIQNGSGESLGSTDVKTIDVYFKKQFSKFDFGVEAPFVSGTIGNVFSTQTDYKTKAVIFKSKYKMSESWTFGFDAGQVDGEDGGQGSYEAMYLNPNFQIANLLFRYNLRAISDTNQNIYDSYITNTTYLKAFAQYTTERWTWDFAAIYAKANQVAQGDNTLAYNHETNKSFTSTVAQSDDLGFELDSGFNYRWNSEISIGGQLGWLFTGDYFAYTNSNTPNTTKNSYSIELNTLISF